MKPLLLLWCCASLVTRGEPTVPTISDAQRASFWRAAKELEEWKARFLQAQLMMQKADAAVKAVREEMVTSCGKQALGEDNKGEPICTPNPTESPKPLAP